MKRRANSALGFGDARRRALSNPFPSPFPFSPGQEHQEIADKTKKKPTIPLL
jgi:hypothetical protein